MSFDDHGNITLLYNKADGVPRKADVLLLEDDKVDREAIKRAALKADLDLNFHYAETLADFSDQLDAAEFDLAILDFRLPDGTGLEALRLVAQSKNNRACATIMVASEAEISIAVAALKSGCSDYMIKEDLTPATMRRAIINAMQKSVLRDRVTQAGTKLVTLRDALREHGELSAAIMRPMLEKSLAQLSAIEFALIQSGQNASEARLGIIAENCRLMIKLCKGMEQDAELAKDSLSLNI